MTMIDMHAHWRPAEVADALRARTREPRILRNQDGVEVLKAGPMGEAPLAEASDDVAFHLDRMDRQGVEVSVLSLLGAFCWIEAQPLDVSGPLCRRVNDRLSAVCEEHPGRFAAYAALPLTPPAPRPGDAFPKVAGEVDNARRRNGTLDMQASLSSVMVTLSLTDYLADYPDAMVHVHNLGGNIPYEVERMDHRCLLDTPNEELPSSRFRRAAPVYVDCNSFGRRP